MKHKFFKLFLGVLLLPGILWAGATFSRIVTFSDGQILTASDLNGEYDNILNNLTPAGVDDYSATVTQMRSTADPYPGSVESQATSLAGEIERLRYQILQLKKSLQASDETHWYQDAPTQGAITIDSGNKFVGFNDTTPDANVSIDSSGNGLPASLAFHGGSQNRFWILGSTSTNALFFGQGASGSSQPTDANYALKIVSDNTITFGLPPNLNGSQVYATTSSAVIPASGGVATNVVLSFGNEVRDSLSEFNGSTFTATNSGMYLICAGGRLTASGFDLASGIVQIRVNASAVAVNGIIPDGSGLSGDIWNTIPASVCTSVYLSASDKVDVITSVSNSGSSSFTFSGTGIFSVTRIQ